jgi:phosphoglycerate dehydrogenase-like enzyme
MSAPLALYVDPEGMDLPIGLLSGAGFIPRIASPRGEAELIEVVRATQPRALLVSYLPVTDAVLAAAPGLRIVSVGAVGYDCVDVDAATRRGIWVTNVPDAATDEVATHALSMALALVRHLPFLDRHVRAGGWEYDATGVPRPLGELTLGIVGLGRIGRRLAELARGLFDAVAGYDPVVQQHQWPPAVRRMELEECLRASDVLSLHVPLTADTTHLLDARTLGLLPNGAFVVNVSRGRLIDGDALLAALDSGALAGAALDVAESEPPAPDDPLRHHPRVLITPHAAFYSKRALKNYALMQAANVIAWHHEGSPNTPVNDPRGR